MKKILLLLTMSLLCTLIHAQQIDTAHIAGRWNLYALGRGDLILYRDSIGGNIERVFKAQRDHHPDIELTTADSLKGVNEIRTGCETLFKTFMDYDGRGHITALITLHRDPGQDLIEESGEYIWTADNTIIQKLGTGPRNELTILHLTDSKLVLLYNHHDHNTAGSEVDPAGVELTFTKAK